MGKPIPKSLKNEVKCEGCKTGFRPEPNEKGRKFCYGCDPNNVGKVTVVAGKGDDVIYQDRAGKVDAAIESLEKRVEALEKAKETK